MAEPAPARLGAPATVTVEITFSASGYSPVPQNSSVANNGTVSFICTQACWIWTIVGGVLTNAFVGEHGDYLACAPGNNGPYTPEVQNTTITIVPLGVNSNPPTPSPAANVRGTIMVTSGLREKKERQ
jgi:hypothetical protein